LAKAVAEANALTVAKFLVQIISLASVPRILPSDQGTHFVNRVIEKLSQQVGITHLTSSPYRPLTNGKVERFHRTLMGSLIKEVTMRQGECDQYIPVVLF